MLEMDWTYPAKTNDLHHTSSPGLEPPGKEKAQTPKKHLAPWSGGWKKEDGLRLKNTSEAGPGLGCLEKEPSLYGGAKGNDDDDDFVDYASVELVKSF